MRRSILAVLLILVVFASVSQANFAVVEGFSGRYGATCASCHTPHPAFDDVLVRVEGLPEAWVANGSYPLRVVVTGGPPAVPNMPQGGFELETDLGVFETNDPTNLRVTIPNRVTYTPEGTLLRAWEHITWIAPNATGQAPQAASFWVAGIAANGNHEAFVTNSSVLGEFHDSSDARIYVVPADASVERTWLETPLKAPRVDTIEERPEGLRLHGVKGDPFTERVRIRVDAGPVQEIMVQEAFQFQLQGAGSLVYLQGIGQGRESLWVSYVLQEDATPEIQGVGGSPHTRDTPTLPAVVALLVILCARRLSSSSP